MSQVFRNRPFFCNYWLTYRCNSKCTFCHIWQNPRLKNIQDARFVDVKKNLDDLKEIGVKMIDFTGGEPLLNKDLPQILSYARQLGFFVKLATNGLLYPENAEELRGLPSRVYISFDTTSAEEYKRIRGVDGFQSVLESIRVAKLLKQDLCLFSTVTDHTLVNIPSIIEFAQKNKVVVFFHPCFSYFDNEPLEKNNIKTLKKYFWQPYVRMNLPQLAFYQKGGNDVRHPSCKVGKSTLDIGPDNCLTIPCFHKHFKRVKLEGNLLSLYNSDDWSGMFEKAGGYEFCQHCTIDCYFGLSYWDKVGRYFFKQNISFLNDMIENHRKN